MKVLTGLLGGGGLVHQKLTGSGLVFLRGSGPIITLDLKPDETISLHQENWVAYESSVTFSLKGVSGIKNILWGEGMFLVEMKGPGKVILQTMSEKKFVYAFADAAGDKIKPKKEDRGQKNDGKEVVGAAVGSAAGVFGKKTSGEVTGVGQPIKTAADEAAVEAETSPKADTEHDDDFEIGGDSGMDDGNMHVVGPNDS